MPVQRVSFTNAAGEELAARLDLPEGGAPVAYALFAHCFTCSKNIKALGHISDSLVKNGFGVFRFDFTGLGESEGDFSDTNFSSNVEDLVDASSYMAVATACHLQAARSVVVQLLAQFVVDRIQTGQPLGHHPRSMLFHSAVESYFRLPLGRRKAAESQTQKKEYRLEERSAG